MAMEVAMGVLRQHARPNEMRRRREARGMPREGGEARGMYREYDSIAFNWELKEALRPAGGGGRRRRKAARARGGGRARARILPPRERVRA